MFARSYTVHLPPDVAPRSVEAADKLKLVKDGFTWGALLFPMIWALLNRMWLPFLGYLAITLVLQSGLAALGVSEQGLGLCFFLINLFFALEAGALLRWSLNRKGWQTLFVVTGRNFAECEAKAFSLLYGDEQAEAPAPEPHLDTMPASRDTSQDDVIGLFPVPESSRW